MSMYLYNYITYLTYFDMFMFLLYHMFMRIFSAQIG